MLQKGKKLGFIADSIGARLLGDPECLVYGLAPLDRATASDVSFVNNRSYVKYLSGTEAAAVIIAASDEKLCKTQALICADPRLSLVRAAHLFLESPKQSAGIHPTAVIGQDCQIASSVSIGPYCVLGDRVILEDSVVVGPGCTIGSDSKLGVGTELQAQVRLYHQVSIGARTLIHSGVVVGSDGFGFAQDQDGWLKMPHLGGVHIGDAVEIGANTTIDRGVFEDTHIGDQVIIDNLVQIAHNVRVGTGTAIAACVAIGGSTVIGAACLIGGGTSIAGHLQIADRVHIAGASAVHQSLNEGTYASGLPAKPAHQWRRNVARFQYLDEMAKRLNQLEKQLNTLLASGASNE